ncbi:MAG: DUF433 domain-containing protein [Candidatus Latescibacter sp.]|nr:DUF433 domain-containing protein [Candidatus Latescibacter sp.]
MQERVLLTRITFDPNIMAGKPVIKGTRLTVEYILNLLARGATPEEIIAEYKGLTLEDIQACLLFAACSLDNSDFMPLPVEKV